jgi:myo-inositol-1(or 4)-monophosphatase
VTSGQHNTNRALLATCVAAAVRAADIIRDRSVGRRTLVWEQKSEFDFVTDVDRAAEGAISELVLERHPDARMRGEELSPAMDDQTGLVFVADPLDGTTNFLHGLPWYAVSIAAQIDGVLQAAAVLNVPNGELFTATKGGGTRLNGQPVQVSAITEPARAVIATGFPFKGGEQVDEYLLMLPRVMRESAGIRRYGAASLDLAGVACGRFDAFWELTLAPWDIAAGMLLIREAGGIVTDLAGGECPVEHTGMITGNPTMHTWLMNIVGSRVKG